MASSAPATSPPPVTPARPITVQSEAAKERMLQTIYRERTRTDEFLRHNALSHFAAVQRKDFAGKKSLVIGRDPDCDLRIQDPLILPRHLRITVRGDLFDVETLHDSATFRVDLREPRDTTLAPSSTLSLGRVGEIIGRFNIRLSHQNDPAVILYDARSPNLAAFRGLKHYKPDLSYTYTLPLTRDPEPDTIEVTSTRGQKRRAVRPGWFDFMVDDQPCRLEALRLLEPGAPSENLAVFFKDATNGSETFVLGRYLDARPLGRSGNYLLDFNQAFNPACAFSAYYNCPLPTRANVLTVPIPAGEKDSKYLTAGSGK
jgi:hypothetical protein